MKYIIYFVSIIFNTVDICTYMQCVTIIYPIIMNGEIGIYSIFIVIKLHDGSVGCGESIGIRSAGTGEK